MNNGNSDVSAENERFKPLIAENVFSGVFDVAREVLSKVVIQKVATIPGVEQEIEKQKTEAGKDIVWKYLPFILIGTALTFLIVRFK